MKKNILLFLTFLILIFNSFMFSNTPVGKWDIFEISLNGPSTGNPFKDVTISAAFMNGNMKPIIKGFYAGNGIYKIRFMPDSLGSWRYRTISNVISLANKKGEFECIPPSLENHGVVRIKDTIRFAYSDGKQFYPFGTTCYAWIHQTDSLQELTVKTLSKSPFNKVRMCIFPKRYAWNENEPLYYPYEGTPPNNWDFSHFNSKYFENLEKRIKQLEDLGIECDLILFHPYDGGHWGFDRMTPEQNNFYLRYIIARLSAFRNVWWSLANEYDFISSKKEEDWDRFFKILQTEDPYNHLRSIHNGRIWYDHTKPWVTHASIQADPWNIREWREKYKKPIIVDECKYEGNIKYSWGDLTAQDMTMRIWIAMTSGGYASHGETYMDSNDVLWWSKGGVLKGESPARIGFLQKIVESAPPGDFEPFVENSEMWNRKYAVKVRNEFILIYFGDRQPIEREIMLPGEAKYSIEIIDTWNMTITRLGVNNSGKTLIHLPGKPYIALRAIKIKS